jgi:hypothetical protein
MYGESVIGDYYGIQTTSLYSRDLSIRTAKIFVWRKYMIDRPIQLHTNIEGYYQPVEMPVVLGQDFIKNLETTQKIYSNDDVTGYYL